MTGELQLTAAILLGLGLLALLFFLIMLARRISYYGQTRRITRPPRGVSYIAIIIAIVLLVFSWIFFRAADRLKSFRPFRPMAKVCMIDITETPDPVKSLRVIIYTLHGDSLKSSPEIYLSGDSWSIKGQYVKFGGFLRGLFPSPSAYKINDLYGKFILEEKSKGEVPILGHQEFEGGEVDLGNYINSLGFLKRSVAFGEFEIGPTPVGQSNRWWLSFTETGQAQLEPLIK